MTKATQELTTIQKQDFFERSFDPVGDAEQLRTRLSHTPLKTVVDKYTKKLHVPISTLEWTMDWVFGPACWSISETSFEEKGTIGKTSGGSPMIGFVITVKVKALHPISGFVVEQTGVASSDYTYGRFKTAFAAAQGLAFKNACKKWGRVFGRDLNRELVENFSEKWDAKQIMDQWHDDGVDTIQKLNKASKVVERQYKGRKLDVAGVVNQYKAKYLSEKE